MSHVICPAGHSIISEVFLTGPGSVLSRMNFLLDFFQTIFAAISQLFDRLIGLACLTTDHEVAGSFPGTSII
jgi:hypothetical protein